jgi:hypothetical protein
VNRVEVAKCALGELPRAPLNVSLAWSATELTMQHRTDQEHYLDGFRRAGLN